MSKQYTVQVIETVALSREYTILADSREEAELKACVGDTVHESTLQTIGVVDRQLDLENVEDDAF